ncbi:hypothetical protein ABPG72_019619 [Tetrahymena utriculariae]
MNHSLNIQFKIHYQTYYSYALYISGSSKELGCWDPNQAIRLDWTQGNLWTTSAITISEGPHDYKYFVAKFDNPAQDMKWEQGPNRSINTKGYQKKNIEISDVWEYKKVILRLFESTRIISCDSPNCLSQKCPQLLKSLSTPPKTTNHNSLDSKQSLIDSQLAQQSREHSSSISSNSTQASEENNYSPDSHEKFGSSGNLIKERYYVTANIESMGNMIKLQKMKKYTYRSQANTASNCSEQKEIVFWEKQFLVKASQQNLKYKYAYKSEAQYNDQMERKSHKINFSKNDVDYQGAFCINDKWQMNQFNFDKITESISLGPYPENQEQIKMLAQSGVKAVFNLQTEQDMEYHGTNWENIKKLYSSNGIKAIHYPVTDMDVHDMAYKLHDAVDRFAKAIEKWNHVYIHCTSGIYRSPQVIVAYLNLYQQIDVNKAISQVESKRPITKKNRDYLRQVYAIKGGYGKIVKQINCQILEESNRKSKSPSTNQFSPLLKIEPKVSKIQHNPQKLSKASSVQVESDKKICQHNSVYKQAERNIQSHQDMQQQYFKQQKKQQNIFHQEQQQQMLLQQHYYSLEEIQTIRRKYLKQQQKASLSSLSFHFQNINKESLSLRGISFWDKQPIQKELQRRRHSLINYFQYESNSPQIWA